MNTRPGIIGAVALASLSLFTIIDPSPLFAARRTVQIESCHLEPDIGPGPSYVQTTYVVMDFVAVDRPSDRVVRGMMSPDAKVTRLNYRYACPAGQRIEVWLDPRYPAFAYRARWQMIPWVSLGIVALFGYLSIRALQYRAPEKSEHEEHRVSG